MFDDDKAESPADRPGLIEAFCNCSTGDALMVWSARTLGESIESVEGLLGYMGKRRIGLKTIAPWCFEIDPSRRRFAHLVDVLLRHGDAMAQAVKDGFI